MYGDSLYLPPFEYVEGFGVVQNRGLPNPTISPPGGNGFADGVVYIDGKDGIEYALDLVTGKQIWSFRLGAGSANALAVSEAALAGNALAVGFAGSVFALNANGNGTQQALLLAGVTITLLPTLLLVIFGQRWLVRGFTAGAVK